MQGPAQSCQNCSPKLCAEVINLVARPVLLNSLVARPVLLDSLVVRPGLLNSLVARPTLLNCFQISLVAMPAFQISLVARPALLDCFQISLVARPVLLNWLLTNQPGGTAHENRKKSKRTGGEIWEACKKTVMNASSILANEECWSKSHSELQEFRNKHGHCKVPQRHSENLTLGTWVNNQ